MEPAERANKRNLWGPFWPLGEALRFLTILPLGGLPPISKGAIARAIGYFPLAGAVIGALLSGVGLLSGALWDDWVRAVAIVVAWGAITAGSAGAGWLRAVVLAPVLGRWADTYGIFWFPPARAGGLGREFQSQLGRADFVLASGITVVLAVALGGARGLVALALTWVVTQVLGMCWTRDLGGLTGDTYGALCEIAEVVALGVMSSKL